MKKIFFLMTFSLASVLCYSQIIFEKSYGCSLDEYGESVIQTLDSGYAVVGYESTHDMLLNNLYILRTNKYGDSLWSKIYSGDYNSYGYDIANTNDTGFIITGSIQSSGQYSSNDIFLIKTNSYGDTQWVKTYNGYSPAFGYSVTQTIDGGYIITGVSGDYLINGTSLIIIKTNSNGDLTWVKTYKAIYGNVGHSISQTNDGGYIVAGTASSFGSGYSRVYLVKTNPNGDTLWTKTISKYNHDTGISLYETSDSAYIISGFASPWSGNIKVLLIKTDLNGDTLWTKVYGGNDNYHFCCNFIEQTNDGNFFIAGSPSLIKTNSNGDTLWTKNYPGRCLSGSKTYDDGFIITGSISNWPNQEDIFLIKTDSFGNSIGTLGIINESLSLSNKIITVKPNPTNGQIKIHIPPQFGKTKSLEVFNCIEQLQIYQTDRFTDLDISNLTSGLYFLVLTNTDNERQTIKIIKE
jgi:hypothetical protein